MFIHYVSIISFAKFWFLELLLKIQCLNPLNGSISLLIIITIIDKLLCVILGREIEVFVFYI